MTAPHSSYEDLAAQRRGSAEYREGHAEARRAFLIGQAVRERRLALGLSQTELASRAVTMPTPSIGVLRSPCHSCKARTYACSPSMSGQSTMNSSPPRRPKKAGS